MHAVLVVIRNCRDCAIFLVTRNSIAFDKPLCLCWTVVLVGLSVVLWCQKEICYVYHMGTLFLNAGNFRNGTFFCVVAFSPLRHVMRSVLRCVGALQFDWLSSARNLIASAFVRMVSDCVAPMRTIFCSRCTGFRRCYRNRTFHDI